MHVHTEEKPGRRGATRAAYDHNNPMLIVKKIYDDYPQADTAEIQRRVRALLTKRPQEANDAFVDYATANCIERIIASERKEPEYKPTKKTKAYVKRSPAEKQAYQATIAAEAASMLNRAKNEWRLEQTAPNGKALGDCTGTELSQFTGFYKELAKGVGSNQKLRDVKTGDDIAKAQTWPD